MQFCSNWIGNFGVGEEDNQMRKSLCGPASKVFSRYFSNAGSQNAHKWQLASNAQNPALDPSSIILVAFGSWPWPKEMLLHCTLRSTASALSCAVGSMPGVRTKSSGVVQVDSSKTASRSMGGGSTNLGSIFTDMNCMVAGTTRSPRMHLTTMSFCNTSRRPSHSPGKASFSGSALLYHFFQSRSDCSIDAWKPLNASMFPSTSVMLSHMACVIHSGAGLAACVDLSKTCPANKKKEYSSAFKSPMDFNT
mmetsp:Transcript_66786/g.204438  ORF Transcript_66786/g.204438 Transcript_66786/m.204438 type:complete len:250 (+) Transcript_66786:1453-2202(+)